MTPQDRMDRLTDNVNALTVNVNTLTGKVNTLTDKMNTLADKVDTLTENVDSMRESVNAVNKRTIDFEFIGALQKTNEEDIARLIEQDAEVSRQIRALTQNANLLNERTIQAMDAINRLARIAESYEDRIQGLEDQEPS